MDEFAIMHPHRQRMLMAAICFGALTANLDSTIVNVRLSTVTGKFEIPP